MTPYRPHFGVTIAATGLAAMTGRVHIEVTRQIALAVRIAPEKQRHGGNGLGADQLADLVHHGLALLVPGLDGRAQLAALHDAGHQRQIAVAADKGAREVGAAG